MITSKRIRLALLVFTSLLLPTLVLAQNFAPSDNVTVQVGSAGGGMDNGHLQVQYQVNGKGQNQSNESLIRFNLTGLLSSNPPVTAADIQSANLILFVNSGGAGGNVTVCELAATPLWSSAAITGTTIPTCSTQTAVFTVTSSQLQYGAFISVPVTMMVQSWLTAGATNNGIELEADAPAGGAMAENLQFDSLANNGQGFAPELEVVLNTGVTSLSTGSGLLVNGDAGPAAGPDTLTVDTTVIATNASVTSAVSGGVTTAENFATTAANNAQTAATNAAETFATTAANNAGSAAVMTAETFATNAVMTALGAVGAEFLSLSGGKVSGAVEASTVNSDTTVQIQSQDVLKADTNSNTATGFQALMNPQGASENDAHGVQALMSLTTGSQNTGHGKEALKSAKTASKNSAQGYEVLMDEDSGSNNVAQGMQAMMSHTSGDDNTAIGTQAGLKLLTGEKNVLIGKLAGQLLKSSESTNILINNDGVTGESRAIHIGNDTDQQAAYMAGVYEKDHSSNTNAAHVLIDKTTGQIGVDAKALQSTVTQILTGSGLKASVDPTGTGANMLTVDTSVIAQQSDVTNAVATALGYATTAQTTAESASLSLAAGGKVTAAVEAQTLNSDTTLQIQAQDVLKADAKFNTASGFGALISATTAAENDAHGYSALSQLTSGIQNAAEGKEALKNATTASQNAAQGMQALLNELTGSNNVAQGMQAMKSHTSGDDNTAIGTQAGMNLLTGEKNVLIGKLAGQLLKSTESKEILINHDGATGESNTIHLGNDTDQLATFISGIAGTTLTNPVEMVIDSITHQLGTISSSRRYKEDVHDMGAASDALLRLRPVTFRYKKPHEDGSKPIQYGLIAEEVADVYPDLVVRGKDGQIETVQYYKLDAMLLNEVQKLSKAHAEDQTEIAALRSQVAEQLKQGQQQQVAMKQLLAQMQSIQTAAARGRAVHSHGRVARTSTRTAASKKAGAKARRASGQVIASAARR